MHLAPRAAGELGGGKRVGGGIVDALARLGVRRLALDCGARAGRRRCVGRGGFGCRGLDLRRHVESFSEIDLQPARSGLVPRRTNFIRTALPFGGDLACKTH